MARINRGTGIPGVRQKSVRPEGGGNPSQIESSIVTILGECAGVVQPGIHHNFYSDLGLKEDLVSGELYDAARFAFKPSPDEEVEGAGTVRAVRVNPATQGTLNLENGGGPAVDIIELFSRWYGAKAGTIACKLEQPAASASNPRANFLSRTVTVSCTGNTDRIGVELGALPAFLIHYDDGVGGGTAAEMTISGTALTTSITGAASNDLNLSFSTYKTLQQLVDKIQENPAYSVVLLADRPNSFLCQDLDYVAAVDILKLSESIDLASTTSLVASNGAYTALTGLNDGDALAVGSEYLLVESANSGSDPDIARGFGDSTETSGTALAATRYYPVMAVTHAVVDWVNKYSTWLTASRKEAVEGTPKAVAKTFLAGASEGTTTTQDWIDAFNKLRNVRTNFIVVCSTDASIHALLKSHMDYRWGLGNSEALAHVPAASLETLAQVKTRRRNLNSQNIALWFQGVNRADDQGVDTAYGPFAMAAMAAGLQAGAPFGEPLTHSILDITKLTQHEDIDITTDGEELVRSGISFSGYYDDAYRVVRCLSTWINDDISYRIEMNVRHSLAFTLYKVRASLKFYHFGKAKQKNDASAQKGTIIRALEECKNIDESIIDGSKEVNGRVVPIPAYDPKSIRVIQVGNVSVPLYDCTPRGGTDFIDVETIVKEFQDVVL